MSDLSSVTLVKYSNKPDLKKCIICGKVGTAKEKLSNAPGSRCDIVKASQHFKGGLLELLDEVEIQSIRFHPTTCYGKYMLRVSRFKNPFQRL